MTGSQASVQQPARSQVPVQQSKGTPTKKEEVPKARGRAFQITSEEAREDPNVVTGTFLVNSRPAHILFDFSALDSFVSYEFAHSFQIACFVLAQPFHVDTAGSISLLADKVYRDCVIEIEGYTFLANLIPISLPNFDIILGMDWLSKNHAELLCYEKIVRIPIEGENPIYVYGEQRLLKIISFLKARKFISKGCSIYLAYTVDVSKEEKKIVNDVLVVNKYPDVFPDDLPGLPPDRQVEFQIDLVPGAAPIAKTPYRLAPAEIIEMMIKLHNLFDQLQGVSYFS